MSITFDHALRFATATMLLLTLVACDKPPPSEVPAPTSVPADSSPDTSPVPAPTQETPPSDTPPAPVQPESAPPPPEEPSAVPKPTAALVGPDLNTMQIARPSAKISVPVDLRYQFDSEPLPGQAATLQLAAVPRVAGSNLKVSLYAPDGVQVASSGPIGVQKATAAGVYRQKLSITRGANGPKQLRVLVTMEVAGGTTFGFFSIPFESNRASGIKPTSSKQR